jgi:hypothetical protein
MNTQLNKQHVRAFEALTNGNKDCFNFDLWASEVRRQMIALLQKKNSEREGKSSRKKMKNLEDVKPST